MELFMRNGTFTWLSFFALFSVVFLGWLSAVIFFRNKWRKEDQTALKIVYPRPISPTNMWLRLRKLDLATVEERLQEKYPDWNAERLKKAIIEYRKFLYLFGVNTGGVIVPWNDDVDEVWHAHILQMKKYEEDCQMLFGELLYHDTSVKRGTQNHEDGVAFTSRAYNQSFSVPANAWRASSVSYDSSSDMPWIVWWMMFGGDFLGGSSITYDSQTHSFVDETQSHHHAGGVAGDNNLISLQGDGASSTCSPSSSSCSSSPSSSCGSSGSCGGSC